MDFIFIILAVIWLGGGNLIIAMSLRRQKLPLIYMILPTVVTKLQGKDWFRLLGLIVFTMVFAVLVSEY